MPAPETTRASTAATVGAWGDNVRGRGNSDRHIQINWHQGEVSRRRTRSGQRQKLTRKTGRRDRRQSLPAPSFPAEPGGEGAAPGRSSMILDALKALAPGDSRRGRKPKMRPTMNAACRARAASSVFDSDAVYPRLQVRSRQVKKLVSRPLGPDGLAWYCRQSGGLQQEAVHTATMPSPRALRAS